MDIIHQLEIAWILLMQSFSTFLTEPMRLISMLGQEEFFIIAMPALYWSLDAGLGMRVGIMLLLSNEINMVLKLAFFSPRPYWIDPNIKAYVAETSFGLPSGHSENAAGIWGLLAVTIRETWLRVVLIVIIVLIGFSRIILGVHFISDVILGWLVGGLTVWAFIGIEKRLVAWLRVRTLTHLLGLALGSAMVLIAVVLLTRAFIGDTPIPEAWSLNAANAVPVSAIIDPLDISGAFTIAGTWFGFLTGVAWLFHRQGGFNTAGTPTQRLLRYCIGLVGVFLFYYGLGILFPRNADALSYSLRFIRYSLVGLWISALAPLLFARLGLANQPQKAEVTPLSIPKNLL